MKKTVAILIFSGVVVGLLSFIFLPLTVDAAGIVPCGRIEGTAEEQQPCTLCHLIVGIQRVIDYGFKIIVFVALVSIVAGGIFYMVSAGNEQMMEKAKSVIKNTLYGFGIVLLAWVIVNYTMYLLSTKPDFGIGIVEWNKFECSTESSALTGGSGGNGGGNGGDGLPTCEGTCFFNVSSCGEVTDSDGYSNYSSASGTCAGQSICCAQPDPDAYSYIWRCPDPSRDFKTISPVSCLEANLNALQNCDNFCGAGTCEIGQLCEPIWY